MATTVQLLEVFRDQDIECPVCKHNLRSLEGDRCPECGWEVRLHSLIQRTQRHSLWPLLLTIGALAVHLPQSLLILQRLIVTGTITYRYWGFSSDATLVEKLPMYASRLYWGVIPLAVVLLVFLHRRFLQLPRRVQWCIAMCAVVCMILAQRRQLLPYYALVDSYPVNNELYDAWWMTIGRR